MSANIVSISCSRGGSGVTSMSLLITNLLSRRYKVLAVDFSSQGHLSKVYLNWKEYDQNILTAMLERDPRKYIVKLNDNLDILPANENLNLIPKICYRESKLKVTSLNEILEKLRLDYDYIVIDLPLNQLRPIPDLCLLASDFLVIPATAGNSMNNKIKRSIKLSSEVNPSLFILGIVYQRKQGDMYNDLVNENELRQEFSDLVFENVITWSDEGLEEVLQEVENNDFDYGYPEVVNEIIKRIEAYEYVANSYCVFLKYVDNAGA